MNQLTGHARGCFIRIGISNYYSDDWLYKNLSWSINPILALKVIGFYPSDACLSEYFCFFYNTISIIYSSIQNPLNRNVKHYFAFRIFFYIVKTSIYSYMLRLEYWITFFLFFFKAQFMNYLYNFQFECSWYNNNLPKKKKITTW